MTGDRISIETDSRKDALELLGRLGRHHSYLIQHAESRWEVCVRPEPELDRTLLEVLSTVESWASDRHAESVVHAGGRAYPVRG